MKDIFNKGFFEGQTLMRSIRASVGFDIAELFKTNAENSQKTIRIGKAIKIMSGVTIESARTDRLKGVHGWK